MIRYDVARSMRSSEVKEQTSVSIILTHVLILHYIIMTMFQGSCHTIRYQIHILYIGYLCGFLEAIDLTIRPRIGYLVFRVYKEGNTTILTVSSSVTPIDSANPLRRIVFALITSSLFTSCFISSLYNSKSGIVFIFSDSILSLHLIRGWSVDLYFYSLINNSNRYNSTICCSKLVLISLIRYSVST